MTRRLNSRLNWRMRPSTALLHLLGVEALLVVLAVVICLAAVVAQAPEIVAKARASSQFFDVRPLQAEMVEQLALEGSVPDAVEPGLGLRPAASASEAAAPMLWLCGDRRVPAGYVATPALVASGPLFSVCREGRASW